jgi:hypothetical protein
MAKKPEWEVRHPRAGRDVRELEQRMMDGEGRDPTARRGELEEGGFVSDADVGEDQIFARDVEHPLRDASADEREKRVEDEEPSQGGGYGNPMLG